jgi:hypothetical protein
MKHSNAYYPSPTRSLSQPQHRVVGAARRQLASASALLLSALALGACSDEATVIDQSSGGTASPAAPESPASEQPDNPAIMVVGQLVGPEGSFNTYVGLFPEMPTGDVDFSNFREFGNANAYSNAGYVFVEEEGVMQRFSVDENLQLVDGPRFSWQDFGIASINGSYTVFASADRAYTFAPELNVVIVWSPEEMIQIGTLPMEMPERPAGMETFAYDGAKVGDKVVWNVFSGNWDSITPYQSVTLAVADANSDAPVRFVEDDRCLPGGPARVADDGTYYVHAGGYYGYFLTYGAPEGRACILSFDPVTETFDPDYLVDYQTLMGSYVSEPLFYVGGDDYIARAWDPAVPFPENPEEFFGNAAFQPLLVNPATGTSAPYPDLAGAQNIDGTTRIVDGVSYYQLSQTGYVENGNTDIVELHPEGVVHRFHLNGFMIGLDRVR